MVQLNDDQVDLIQHRIATGGVITNDLQNGLLDHYCCFIEELMTAGTAFETAYNQAFVAITPNGMHEIEDELYFILTFKQTTIMKRTIYGFGFLATFCLSTGLMFRSLHWPGVSALTFAGFISLIITSVTLVSNIMRHRSTHTPLYNIRVALGLISVLLISSGGIFKLLNYPYANIQFMIGLMILNFLFLPMFFYYLYKQALQSSLSKQS